MTKPAGPSGTVAAHGCTDGTTALVTGWKIHLTGFHFTGTLNG
jgi:hypothetical protein